MICLINVKTGLKWCNSNAYGLWLMACDQGYVSLRRIPTHTVVKDNYANKKNEQRILDL
jgi:hypothetical protein